MKNDIREFRLRSNPEYELVLLDRLSEAEQQALAGLKGDPDCYGILRPRSPGKLSLKAASRDAALLFFTLQTPGHLPSYVKQSLGEECDRTISQMVLDSILEIEIGGAMLSGPAAYVHICSKEPTLDRENFLAALSRRALQYAETLDINDASALSMKLYNYNRLPASPRWRQLLPDQEAAERYLEIEKTRSGLSNWTRVEQNAGKSQWLAWQSPRVNGISAASGSTYKLYVSPACSALGEAFHAVAAIAGASAAHHFKVGNDVYGLLRPDKMVLYFQRFTDLQETSERLMQKLANCPVHGVPFTAELAGNGLLSWGIDPPAERTVPWLERESWRLRVINHLATAMLLARNSGNSELPPWRFAMERLRLEGIETETWTPSHSLAWVGSGPGESYGAN